ncbi:glycosyltransferase family 2 protein [Algoriphagus chordae]|uniref:Glycosyltransferase involved in cell wall biosynthesis n=1 Tax=Algoriphagus chordae TaxID=237019 RepID=A0A2W7RMY4_9BACT|nr:glycosyltransferase [Algoriphagus chordae]PZX52085.1 glycosyltransferase involved in cell wall biosynthesis [Algoriphagus chordae]
MSISVSVILPVFNQEQFLDETILSILDQSYQEFELLILDDGSTDGSAEIIRKYSQFDNRIKSYFRENRGKCVSTNELVDKAEANWCVFLDSDDVMFKNRIEDQIAFHQQNPELLASSCHCDYIDNDGEFIGTQTYPFFKGENDWQISLKNNEIVLCAFTGLMVKKDVYTQIGGLRSAFWPCEDMDFINRFIEHEFPIQIIQKPLMKYRIHDNSVTSKRQWDMFRISDYVSRCAMLRRSGEREISFGEFVELDNQNSLIFSLKRKLLRYSQIWHRKAGYAYYKKQYVTFSKRFLLAFCFSPAYVYSTVRNRF